MAYIARLNGRGSGSLSVRAALMTGTFLCLASPAFAQSASTPADDIVVVASKLGASTDKAPIAVSTVSSADLEAYHLESLNSIKSTVPSLVFDTSSAFAQPYIRGIGSNFSLAGLETAVATYVDGVYLQRQAGGILDLVDLKSVQVLKGPQGTLYGRNATGGVILLETADPEAEFGGTASAEYGRFDHYKATGAVNLPVSDTLKFRISGLYQQNNGYFKYADGSGKRGEGDRSYIRAKALWEPTDKFNLTYSLEYNDSNSTAYSQRAVLPAPYCVACSIFGATIPTGGALQVSNSRNAFSKVEFWAHTLKLNYQGDNFNVTSITGYRDQTVNYRNDQDFVSPNFFDARITEKGPTITNDTYARTQLEGPLNFLAGFSLERERDTQNATFEGLAFAPLSPFNRNKVKIDSYSIYGEASYDITSELRATAGARFNHDRKRIFVTNNPDAVLAAGGVAAFEANKTFENVTPRFVLSYDKGDALYYASYNRGTRSGGFGSPIIAPSPAVSPEVLDNFEIGAKNRFLDGRLRTTFDVFYGIYKDIQIQIVDASTSTVLLENAAKGKVSGVEFEAQFDVTDAFNLRGGVTYLDNTFKNYDDAAIFAPVFDAGGNPLGIGPSVADLSGTRLPRSPKWSGFIAASYTADLGADWQAKASGVARVTSSYLFSAGAGGPLNIDRVGGYEVVDATLDFVTPDKQTKFGFYANNLLNEKYASQALTAAFGAFTSPSLPRTYGIRISRDF